ncbi:hypothetical protein J3R30DRAFT_2124128 [Lentinula aciculospora]|uniref:Uncharacterized protein n=1 Tax=Lentinula aciculospora TaxID=153920 RepID=A0A9W9AHR2_9AGAR|nr:hypothetical protein J3R30DRAFT_2124128 [Lentinula aciculospora]
MDTCTTPQEIEFSSILPTTFRDRDRDIPIPPSHEISLAGLPGLYSQCTYALKILFVNRGPLWNKTKTCTIPFKYYPRSRPSVPLLTNDGIRPGLSHILCHDQKRTGGVVRDAFYFAK